MTDVTIFDTRVFRYHRSTSHWTASIRSLGMLAYGDTRVEAERNIERLLTFSLKAMDRLGLLENWLTRCGARWVKNETG